MAVVEAITITPIPYGSRLYELSAHFREQILRAPLGLTLDEEDVQGEENQTHIAALEDDHLLGTVVLKPLPPEKMKLRQMAIDPSIQKQGLGRKLVAFAEDFARAHAFKMIELHARTPARGFYERLGYHIVGDQFVERTITCIKMEKDLYEL